MIPFEGVRTAVPIDADIVYRVSEKTVDNSLVGGTGSDLADQVYKSLEKIGLSGDERSRVRAIHADGQYQSSTFQQRITDNIGDKNLLLPWDQSHWIDIVMEEARDHAFMKRLVRRTNKLHKMFGQGKGHAEYKGLAKSLGLKALDTVVFSTTRFFSSAFESFDKVYESYESLIKAYMEYRQTADEEEEAKYEVRGQDFAIDLCLALDILFPIIILMIESQRVNLPVWKVVGWFPRVIK